MIGNNHYEIIKHLFIYYNFLVVYDAFKKNQI